MNEIHNRRKKRITHFIGLLIVLLIVSCKTTSTIVPDNGNGAGEVRDDLAIITSGQTELAITGTEIAGASTDIENSVNDLADAITSGTNTDGSFEEIIRAVRKRPLD